jgi:hypothetical protein
MRMERGDGFAGWIAMRLQGEPSSGPGNYETRDNLAK